MRGGGIVLQAQHTFAPLGQDAGPCTTVWFRSRGRRVQARSAILANLRSGCLLKLLKLLKLRDTVALPPLNLC